MYTVTDVTRSLLKLGSSRVRTLFGTKNPILAAERSTIKYFKKINIAMIMSMFEIINWENKKVYENFVPLGYNVC